MLKKDTLADATVHPVMPCREAVSIVRYPGEDSAK